MNPHVDLRLLAVRRDEPAGCPPPRRRLLFSRYVLPGAVLLGFLGVGLWAGRDQLLPARPVTVVPVLTTRTASPATCGVLFQAAGWVEPRPTPFLVPALAEGVVDRLLVVENQAVQAGEPVAHLIDADARLTLNTAATELQMRENEAAALVAKVETDWLYLPYQIQAAEARLHLASADLAGKKTVPGAVPALTIQRAESELIAAQAAHEELQVRKHRLARELVSLRRMRDAMHQGASVQTEGPLPLTEAEVNMKVALNRVAQAQVGLETARLRLERMTVRAPSAGRVLALVARPGLRLMGMVPGTQQEASTVVSLYNPQLLQIRADVRLEDVPRVHPGYPARIETPAAPKGPLEGEVLFATSVTDIQKNTLQVKVSIKAPPSTLKPDMLVQVAFLAPAAAPANDQNAEATVLRLVIPRQLVDNSPAGAQVWLADQVTGVARPRRIQLGAAQGNDLVEVTGGLTVADKLIVAGREGLTEGQRIRIIGEDSTLGVAGPEGAVQPARMARLPVTEGSPRGDALTWRSSKSAG